MRAEKYTAQQYIQGEADVAALIMYAAELEAALEWYADLDIVIEDAIVFDVGERARRALKE